jgi:hypothetical protein
MSVLQVNVHRRNQVVNQLLDTARHEGFAQDMDALEQYFTVKAALEEVDEMCP